MDIPLETMKTFLLQSQKTYSPVIHLHFCKTEYFAEPKATKCESFQIRVECTVMNVNADGIIVIGSVETNVIQENETITSIFVIYF